MRHGSSSMLWGCPRVGRPYSYHPSCLPKPAMWSYSTRPSSLQIDGVQTP